MSGTMSLASLNELFDYNYWARDRQLQTCAGLTEEQFLRPLGNSFPSLRNTLTHLLAGGCGWSAGGDGHRRPCWRRRSSPRWPLYPSVGRRWSGR